MSLSSRWSLFSRGGGDKPRDDVEGGDNASGVNNGDGGNGGEEVVFSVAKKEEEVVFSVAKKEEEVVKEEETIIENGVNENADAANECVDATECTKTYEKDVNVYFKTQTVNNDKNNDYNNHYKGIKTEVMPTIPVLFIEEFVPAPYKFGSKKSASSVTDLRAYIYYDSYRCVYVLNATRRRDDENGTGLERRYPDIRMTFKSRSSLAFFLRRSTCSWNHDLSVTMYSMYRNVIHLTTCGAMPSFHSIHNCRTKFRTELFGYDDCHVSLKTFESYLKVLKEGGEDGYLFR